MRITLDENYNAISDTDILGYVGEHGARIMYFSGRLYVENAESYSIVFGYDDGISYEEEIVNCTYTIKGPILRKSGIVYCQVTAKKGDGSYIKKSNIFRMKIGKSIENTIPYYGESPLKSYSDVTLLATKIPGEIISDATFKSGYSEYERDENGNIIEKPSVSV